MANSESEQRWRTGGNRNKIHEVDMLGGGFRGVSKMGRYIQEGDGIRNNSWTNW